MSVLRLIPRGGFPVSGYCVHRAENDEHVGEIARTADGAWATRLSEDAYGEIESGDRTRTFNTEDEEELLERVEEFFHEPRPPKSEAEKAYEAELKRNIDMQVGALGAFFKYEIRGLSSLAHTSKTASTFIAEMCAGLAAFICAHFESDEREKIAETTIELLKVKMKESMVEARALDQKVKDAKDGLIKQIIEAMLRGGVTPPDAESTARDAVAQTEQEMKETGSPVGIAAFVIGADGKAKRVSAEEAQAVMEAEALARSGGKLS